MVRASAWSDGATFKTSKARTTMCRADAGSVRTRFLRIYDGALRPELCRKLAADAVELGRPWGCYVSMDAARGPAAPGDSREGWALEVVREVFLTRAAGDVDLAAAHGVAVWCLASTAGAAVDYHLDYCELRAAV